MSEKFTASNGVTVSSETQAITGRRRIKFETEHVGEVFEVSGEYMTALVEKLDHERDQELGRWRYNSYLVIYQAENHQPGNRARSVYVLDERTAKMHMRHEGQAAWREADPELTTAAASYFAAHPLPKPWHDAKPGEVWVLTVDGKEDAFKLHGDLFRNGALWDIEQTDRHITAGRRIWPEGVES